MTEPIVSMKHVAVWRERQLVLSVEQWQIRRGERVALLGPNGAGKSTLLQVVQGLQPFQNGEVRLFGERHDRQNTRRCSMVFQDPKLLSGTVYENVALPLRLRGVSERYTAQQVEAALRLFQCAALKDRPAQQLSGGEARRVCLARALVYQPELLLLDEAFTALDVPTAEELLEVIRRHAEQTGMAVVFVSHQLPHVLALAERAVVLDHGRIVQDSSLDRLLKRPANRLVAQLAGVENVLPCQVLPGGIVQLSEQVRFTLPLAEPQQEAWFCLAAERLQRVTDAQPLPGWVQLDGTVEMLRPSQHGLVAAVRVADILFKTWLAPGSGQILAAGEPVTVTFCANDAQLLS